MDDLIKEQEILKKTSICKSDDPSYGLFQIPNPDVDQRSSFKGYQCYIYLPAINCTVYHSEIYEKFLIFSLENNMIDSELTQNTNSCFSELMQQIGVTPDEECYDGTAYMKKTIYKRINFSTSKNNECISFELILRIPPDGEIISNHRSYLVIISPREKKFVYHDNAYYVRCSNSIGHIENFICVVNRKLYINEKKEKLVEENINYITSFQGKIYWYISSTNDEKIIKQFGNCIMCYDIKEKKKEIIYEDINPILEISYDFIIKINKISKYNYLPQKVGMIFMREERKIIKTIGMSVPTNSLPWEYLVRNNRDCLCFDEMIYPYLYSKISDSVKRSKIFISRNDMSTLPTYVILHFSVENLKYLDIKIRNSIKYLLLCLLRKGHGFYYNRDMIEQVALMCMRLESLNIISLTRMINIDI